MAATKEKHKYRLLYDLKTTAVPEGKTAEEVRAEGLGGADAVFVASILYPEDGSLSVAFVSSDGRTGSDMTDEQIWKIWALLAHQLMESPTLGVGRKGLCALVFTTVREAILEVKKKN